VSPVRQSRDVRVTRCQYLCYSPVQLSATTAHKAGICCILDERVLENERRLRDRASLEDQFSARELKC
jgi:hypothetical protein